MVFLLIFLPLVYCKLVSRSVFLSKTDPWAYVSKFASYAGTGTWELKVKLANPNKSNRDGVLQITSSIYTEQKWEESLSTTTCEGKEQVSKRHQVLEVPNNGSWSYSSKGTFHQKTPHFWYFTLSSCEIQVKTKFKLELLLLNSSDSHHSAEDDGLINTYLLVFLVYLLFMYKNIMRLVQVARQTDSYESHLIWLNFSICFSILSVLFQVFHLWAYGYNGSGLLFFDSFSDLFEVTSSLLAIILLVIIADGWTLTYKHFPESGVYVPVSFVVVTVNLLIVAVGRISLDEHYKNTGYEGKSGLLIILFRLAFWVWFVYVCKKNYASLSVQVKPLLLSLCILGTIYFWALPLTVLASQLYDKFYRKTIIVVGVHIIQIFVFYFLTHNFSNNSSFYKASSLSQGVLPGKAR